MLPIKFTTVYPRLRNNWQRLWVSKRATFDSGWSIVTNNKMADFSKSLAKRSFCLHYWNFQKIKSRRTNNSIKRNSNMFSVFLLRVGDLIKSRTVEYYERVHWRSEECNFEIHPQDYQGHFSVKTFLLTILIQRVNLISTRNESNYWTEVFFFEVTPLNEDHQPLWNTWNTGRVQRPFYRCFI